MPRGPINGNSRTMIFSHFANLKYHVHSTPWDSLERRFNPECGNNLHSSFRFCLPGNEINLMLTQCQQAAGACCFDAAWLKSVTCDTKTLMNTSFGTMDPNASKSLGMTPFYFLSQLFLVLEPKVPNHRHKRHIFCSKYGHLQHIHRLFVTPSLVSVNTYKNLHR